jgi:hypothetical protein
MRKRFYVSGYDGLDWDTTPEFAETADEALAQAQRRYLGTRFNPTEVDPVWDAAIFNGETVLRWNLPPIFPC